MKKIVTIILASSVMLSANVIPGIDSKGGAMTLLEDKLKVVIGHKYLTRDSMFTGSSEVKNKESLDASANVTIMGLKYGVSKNFDLTVVVPFKHISATAKLGANNVSIDNKGIGDVVIMGRYVIFPMKKYGLQVSIGGGLKLPTGSTDSGFKKAPPFAMGVNTPMPTQMGTGAFEYKAELGISKFLNDNIRIDFNTMYTYRPKAKNNYDFEDEISYDLSLTNAVTKNINIGIGYNGKYNSKTDMGNDTNPMLRTMLPFKAFSGTVGYITPQIEYLPFGKPKIHAGFGVSFLAHKDLKEYQPLEKVRFSFRVGYLF